MGFLSHRVKRSDLEAGDHIYTWRTPVFAYSHHGIYIGGDKVVHFTQHQNLSSGDSTSFRFSSSITDVTADCLDFPDCGFRKHTSGVVMSCLNCFLGDGSLYRFEYGVSPVVLITRLRSGTCTTAKSDPPEDVIHRAMHLLQHGFGKYDVFSNNCEDFALYCKTELVVCTQRGSGGSGQVSSVVGVPVAAILSLPLKMFVSNPVVLGATAVVSYNLNRYASDVGVRDDVVKVNVEGVAAFHGKLLAEVDGGADVAGDRRKKRRR
ncbi:protein LEAD-SENSITIVE 1-like [Salvia miltiorrhiza]|uniref:protein LEAD-SENSITIVE 1-like n=1 Tax=Salvia miltiorrhiza TaxID=226208 RepID=UPI0025ACB824|nr:protein LEAD-SENSITIVE 1-like [Salvia miltiorrhiza]